MNTAFSADLSTDCHDRNEKRGRNVKFSWTKKCSIQRLKSCLSARLWFTVLTFIAIAIGSHLSVLNWRLMNSEDLSAETRASLLSNIGLLLAGLVALLFGMWRSWLAQRQTDIAQRVLLNERYQKGTEMLGNPNLTVRLAGIYALSRLASEHPDDYHLDVMNQFSSFIRHPRVDENIPQGEDHSPNAIRYSDGEIRLRQDMQDVMDAIGTRSESGIALERDDEFWLNLRGAHLRGLFFQNPEQINLSRMLITDADFSKVWFKDADLSDAICWANGRFVETRFHEANLSRIRLEKSDLTGAKFGGTEDKPTNLRNANFTNSNLSHAELWATDMSGVNLLGCDLSGAEFSLGGGMPAQGLTQAQLNQVQAHDPNIGPPRLTGVKDAETGESLVWNPMVPRQVESELVD